MVETYVVGPTVLGVVTFLAALLPEHLEERPVSPAIVYVALGAVVFGLPLGLPIRTCWRTPTRRSGSRSSSSSSLSWAPG